MDCVKRGMDVLGESGTETILYHIEARFALGPNEIPHNPQGFVSALQYIFGRQAAEITRAIVEDMRRNATCDRRFLRFAGVLETSSGMGYAEQANYLANVSCSISKMLAGEDGNDDEGEEEEVAR